jgi:hypothetical protein
MKSVFFFSSLFILDIYKLIKNELFDQLSDTMESHAFGSENSDTEDKDYSLSCGSSSFGNDEDLFQGEELENDDEMEETAAVIAEVVIC